MAGFDQGNVFYAESVVSQHTDMDSVSHNIATKMKFNQFIRNFKYKGFDHHYRDVLLQNYKNKHYYLKVQLDDLNQFDSTLANDITETPDVMMALLEDVVNSIADEITKPRPEDEKLQNIQVLLGSNATSRSIRDIKSSKVSKLVKFSGIVLSTSEVRAKATSFTLQCRGCNQYLPNLPVKSGFSSFIFPRKCTASAANARIGAGTANTTTCPLDPYFIVLEKSHFVDFQTVKLQEMPEHVPFSELPRHMQLYCELYLCEKATPGSRVTVIGIWSVYNSSAKSNGSEDKGGLPTPYIRVLGIEVENSGSTRSAVTSQGINEEEEKEFRDFAENPGVYDIIARSIAPNIFGCDDIKKAIACLLIGGSRKRMVDNLTRRGDINILLLGDPGTAKSQLLKFVSECAPISVYTSGKGSSAAGLTASIIRDPKTRKFMMEGGAMVLADGGVVCIDEFDKMREEDRVAIHEAMEQQTISIAKAGITTMLNSRTSVLAAANSVYGHWEEGKGGENIDLMPTILSRFDMIFIVRDIHDESRDLRIAAHNMHLQRTMGKGSTVVKETQDNKDDDVHLSSLSREDGIIPKLKLKKFIAFCRAQCGPRLTEAAGAKLVNQYVQMRSGHSDYERDSGKKMTIPITVRQVEAMFRIAESIAKMRLSVFATETDVEEAIRLFQVSTLDAAVSGSLEGVEEFSSRENRDLMFKLEKSLKRRIVIGSQVSEQVILQDFNNQGYPEWAIKKVLTVMIRRGEIQPRMQNKILLRVQ